METHHREHVIVFEVDDTRCETDKRYLTGAEIKSLAKKPPANILYRLEYRDGHPYKQEIGDAESVHIKEHEHFVTQPPVGKTS